MRSSSRTPVVTRVVGRRRSTYDDHGRHRRLPLQSSVADGADGPVRRRVPHGLRPVPHQVVGCLDIHEEPSSSMKVIFWDVDGVLNNPGTWGAWSKLGWSAALEPHLVKKARDVVRATGAKCVLSS